MSRRLLQPKPRAGVAPRVRRSLQARRSPAASRRVLTGKLEARPAPPLRLTANDLAGAPATRGARLANHGRTPREPSDLFIESGRWRHGSRYRQKATECLDGARCRLLPRAVFIEGRILPIIVFSS